jgi:hypothetical protein
MRATHLVGRFFESVRAAPLDDADVTWVADALEPGELRVWEGMDRVDRAEGVGVARRLELVLASTPSAADTRWRAAALLHDAGKQLSGYGTVGRVTVTVIATLAGKHRTREWATSTSPTRARIGRYVRHDELGAALLRDAGARSEIAAWAEAHHRPEWWGGTGIPLSVCRALAAADGESVPAD